MSILVHLYDLQMLDTSLEQLRHQFITLPEREVLALVQKNIADCAAKISLGELRQQELEKLLSVAEANSATLQKFHTAEITATEALKLAEEYKKAEARDVEEKRQRLAESLDEKWSAAYELRRSQHKGIAVAKVKNHVCGGCHLDLSPSEVDLLKKETDENRECPNCARWLVF